MSLRKISHARTLSNETPIFSHNSLIFNSKILKSKENHPSKERLFSGELKFQKISKEKFNKKNTKNIVARCPFGTKCPYYKAYIELKNQLNSLLFSSKKMDEFTKSLYSSMLKKSKIYQTLIDENTLLKNTIFEVTGLRYNDILYKDPNQNEKTNFFYKKDTYKKTLNKTNIFQDNKLNLNLNEELSNQKNIKNEIKVCKLQKHNNFFNLSLLDNESPKNQTPSQFNQYKSKIKLFKNERMINNLSIAKTFSPNLVDNTTTYTNDNYGTTRRKSIISNRGSFTNPFPPPYESKNHYDALSQFTKIQKLKSMEDNTKYSFLSSNVDPIKILKNNISLNQLDLLTKTDEIFIKQIKISDEETLIKYCNCIVSLINDYKDAIKIGMRMKDFIKESILLVDNLIYKNSTSVFINITCKILQCDRVSLFILDKKSDSLIIYSGEGIKRAEIKVPKNKGIIGACFMEGKKCRIDDAYLDKRFNQEVDKKTNYRTRSILCHPLIDKDGECFGVIEAINKFIPPFNDDDEELLNILAQQASSIFRSFVFTTSNKNLIEKFCYIIDYSNIIADIKSKLDFTIKTEETLLNLYNCMDSHFYFFEEGKIVKYSKEFGVKKFEKNIGIIGEAIKTKDLIGYQNLKNCVYFNKIVDINSSDGLITVPIISKKIDKVFGVIQVPFRGEINGSGKPKENEMRIIQKFTKCVKKWIKRFIKYS